MNQYLSCELDRLTGFTENASVQRWEPPLQYCTPDVAIIAFDLSQGVVSRTPMPSIDPNGVLRRDCVNSSRSLTMQTRRPCGVLGNLAIHITNSSDDVMSLNLVRDFSLFVFL